MIPKPQVDEAWEWVWRAWWRLHRDRPFHGGGMSAPVPGRIPWRTVLAWSQFHRYPADAVDFLDGLFAVLDGVFFEFYARQMKQ